MDTPLTHNIATSAMRMGAPSERWLIDGLRAGRFRGRKVGRHWRMTDEDIVDALDACVNDVRRPAVSSTAASSGLTPTSRRRMVTQ